MPSLIDIRRRIRSVKNTQQITKAMKMVSSARLRRSQERVISSRPFSRMLNEMLSNVAAAAAAAGEEGTNHPLLAVRPQQRIQLVLITADRGLAGAFNSNLIKGAQKFVEDHNDKQVSLELIGRKGRDFFVRRNVPISGETVGISQMAGLPQAMEFSRKLVERFTSGEVDSVYLLYNEFKSVLAQQIVLRQLLPIYCETKEPARDYIYEQPPAQFLDTLLPRYVQAEVLKAFLETTAAEHAARMTAMDSASNNATEVINKLTLYSNQVRQASITREIIEVVSGASALE